MATTVLVSTLAWQTDLMVRRVSGSQIVDRGDHLVVRTPSNPGFWWGNFVLLPASATADATEAIECFAHEFPDADHLAIGVEGPAEREAVEGLASLAGAKLMTLTTLTATELRSPQRPNDATYRPLETDADWAQAVQVSLATDGQLGNPAHHTFTTQKLAEARAMTRAGHGDYYGAFVAEELCATLGLVTDGSGLARYQAVQTHPDHRGQGLASGLVHHAGRHMLDQGSARALVILADPDYHAIRIYERLGFAPEGEQLSVERPPADAPQLDRSS